MLKEHLIDGDFCADCWEAEVEVSFLTWAWNTHATVMHDLLKGFNRYKLRKFVEEAE